MTEDRLASHDSTSTGTGALQPEAAGAELLARLDLRVELAQATGVLVEVFAVPVEVAARLLTAEAVRRGVTVGDLAAEVVDDPAAVRGWRSGSVCAVCGGAGEVRTFGPFDAVSLLVCRDGHGVIRRA